MLPQNFVPMMVTVVSTVTKLLYESKKLYKSYEKVSINNNIFKAVALKLTHDDSINNNWHI